MSEASEFSEATEFPADVDTSRPHVARMYDYFIGGKNNFAADREIADKVIATVPGVRTGPRENRAFLGRAVKYLAEAGIRQFLDIGTGLPTASSVHEVAQAVAPQSRVVYVDNDPLVLVHARALLTSSPEGRTAYIQADLRDPSAILSSSAVRSVLDFTKPIGLLLVAVLHFIEDADKPAELVAPLVGALPSGSYVAASHLTSEFAPAAVATGLRSYRGDGISAIPRDGDVFAEIAFAGLELVPPGVVPLSEWRRPSADLVPPASEVNCYGGVARKP
jgi:hypothetical protein